LRSSALDGTWNVDAADLQFYWQNGGPTGRLGIQPRVPFGDGRRRTHWTWARVPFGPTRRQMVAVDVPLSTGHPGPSQVVAPRRQCESAPSNRSGWTWHPPGGTGARSVGPGQPGHGVAPSYAERPCGGRRGTYWL